MNPGRHDPPPRTRRVLGHVFASTEAVVTKSLLARVLAYSVVTMTIAHRMVPPRETARWTRSHETVPFSKMRPDAG